MSEPILTPTLSRMSMFPVEHKDLWDLYKNHLKLFWTTQELDFAGDIPDWESLDEHTQFYIKKVLAFFNNSDGIVNENLAANFYHEVQYPEARAFYSMQMLIETIHSEVYSTLIDTYISDPQEKTSLFNAIETDPVVKKKADWALRWIESPNFTERLIAFIAVEGIFFSGSFAALFWLEHTFGKMKALCKSNEFISRDEALHAQMGITLYNNHIQDKLPAERIRSILLDALAIEKEFVTSGLPVRMIGMNADLMCTYLEFVTDGLLVSLGLEKEFGSENPFDFMKTIALNDQTQTNFFEAKSSGYQKPGVEEGSMVFSTNEDF